MVTCGSDRSIRIWNYMTGVCELCKYFPEEAYSVSLHPSGLYLLVGFSDKLRLLNVLMDDFRLFKEFSIRGCREVSGYVHLSLSLLHYNFVHAPNPPFEKLPSLYR
ncbi:hypothetical protein BC829DRAFT_249891 [Chytridium lagenaria]|nr:hypothetical protein BC829DRAFT_249891 [Chytridium lagenaria]